MKIYKLTDIITPYIYSKKLSKCIKLSSINLHIMCSIPYKFLPQNIFTMPSFCTLKHSSVKVSCSCAKSDLMSNICPIYTNQYLPNVYNRQGLNTQRLYIHHI